MTRDAILARKRALEADYQAALNQAQALHGAIQDCDFWLTQLPDSTPVTEEELDDVQIAS